MSGWINLELIISLLHIDKLLESKAKISQLSILPSHRFQIFSHLSIVRVSVPMHAKYLANLFVQDGAHLLFNFVFLRLVPCLHVLDRFDLLGPTWIELWLRRSKVLLSFELLLGLGLLLHELLCCYNIRSGHVILAELARLGGVEYVLILLHHLVKLAAVFWSLTVHLANATCVACVVPCSLLIVIVFGRAL